MKQVKLGMTGLSVSPICFGTWQFGGDWGAVDELRAIAAIRRARDLGINFFDPAQAYGWGASETLLGRALADDLRRDRDSIVIATKGGLRREGGRVRRDASPAALRKGLEESLINLDVDHVDIYQLHWPDPAVPIEEAASGLQALVAEGKARHVGVSNFDVAQMARFEQVRPVETLQPAYHLFRRDIEAEVLPYCLEHDIGVLVYGPLAHGLLGGGVTDHSRFDAGDWRSRSPLFTGDGFERNLDRVHALRRFARERGMTISQLAIAWTLAHPAVHAAIVGTSRANHIDDSVGAASRELDDADLWRIDQIMDGALAVDGPSPERL